MASPLKRKSPSTPSEVNEKRSRPEEDERLFSAVRIGSRKSQLAVVQTKNIMAALKARNPDLTLEMETMETLGDKILHIALPKIGEKSLFTKDLEIALEEKRVDFLVHSLKDLPTTMPEGMALSTIYKRDDPHDCVIFHPKHYGKTLADLPQESLIGTSSLRRVASLKRKYNHLKFESIRGNLNTRLRKLNDEEKFDAIILAKAGVDRLGWTDKIGQVLDENECLYAIGQGAMAVEIRTEDKFMKTLLTELSDIPTLLICVAERSFMKTLNGGCSTPVGCYSRLIDDKLSLRGNVLNDTGSICLDRTLEVQLRTKIPSIEGEEKTFYQSESGVIVDGLYKEELIKAQKLGYDLAYELKKLGADEVLRDVRSKIPKVANIQIPSSSSVNMA